MQLRSGKSYPRYGGSSWSGIAKNVAPYLGSAVAAAAKNYFSGTKTRSIKGSVNPSTVTTQHDVSTRYRRKPMPKRRRKRWVRFSKRVRHVMLQSQPLQSYCIDDSGAVKAIAADTQVTDGQMLGATQATANDELLQIFRAAYGSILNAATVDKYSLFLKSLCLDVQITCTSATKGCVVDIYHLIARGPAADPERIDIQYTNAFAEQSSLSVGTVSSTNPSTTPFQNGPFLTMWKILKKTQVVLGVGQSTTVQMRIPYNRYLRGKMVENYQAQIPGMTRAFLFQFRGLPENNGGVPRLAASEVTWKGQTTIVYGVPPSSTNRAATAEV